MAVKEKRAKRYRSSCPAALQERLQRAATQRLYLVQQSEIPTDDTEDVASVVDFTVLGSTGNVYTVSLGLVPSCTCPDFYKRQDLCKHIMFVLLKVVGLDFRTNPLAYQKAYVVSELKQLFAILRSRRVGGTVLANARVRAAVLGAGGTAAHASLDNDSSSGVVQRRSLANDDSDCPICFDDLTGEPDSRLAFCRGTCGANFHAECIRHWLGASVRKSCPHCRQPWLGEGAAKEGNSNSEGYANFGGLQGQSPVRDTSTYRSYSPYYKRQRR